MKAENGRWKKSHTTKKSTLEMSLFYCMEVKSVEEKSANCIAGRAALMHIAFKQPVFNHL